MVARPCENVFYPVRMFSKLFPIQSLPFQTNICRNVGPTNSVKNAYMYSPEGVLVLRSGDFSPSPRTPAKWPPTAARRPLRCAKWPPPKAERPPRPEGSPRTTAKWPPPKIGRPPRPEGSPRTPARQRSACLTEGACLIEGASTACTLPLEEHSAWASR